MKRVHCIVEGQTEVRVFSKILNPYLFEKTGIYALFTPIKYTKGGIVKYSKIFPEFRRHIVEKDKILTTFFDYYGILNKHNFPLYKEAKEDQTNPFVGAELLERGMLESLKDAGFNCNNFLPYIQLHEFEALLFSSNEGFEFQFDHESISEELRSARNRYHTPEEINDSPDTAPSKRIERALLKRGETYNKVADGENIATIIGIETMLDECPRFKSWVDTLIAKILE